MKIDQRFPSFEIATDVSELRPRFQKELSRLGRRGCEIVELFVPRVFLRNDDSLAIQYRLKLADKRSEGGKDLLLYGNLPLGSGVLPDYVGRHPESIIVWQDLNLVIPIFPFDPKLAKLKGFCNSDTRLAYLKDLASRLGYAGGEFGAVSCELLGYRLERRAVFRCRLQSGTLAKGGTAIRQFIARVVRVNRAIESHDALTLLNERGFAFDSPDRLTAPKPLGLDVEHGVYLMEDVDGKTLNDLLTTGEFGDGCAQAAALLNKLHALSAGAWPLFTSKDELAGLGNLVSVVTGIFPSLASESSRILAILREKEGELPQASRLSTIHRDFYDKQVIYSPERVTLIDLDNLSTGDPAQDYGNFLAHLTLRELQEPDSVLNIMAGRKRFDNIYVRADTGFSERAIWWQTATLLRLAMLYALRPRWRSLGSELINEATTMISKLSTIRRIPYAIKNQ